MAIEHDVKTEVIETRIPVESVANSAKVLTGGFVGKGFGGLAAIVLSILGLAGLGAPVMACVAAIVIGAAMLWEGGAVLSQFDNVVSGSTFGSVLKIEAGTLLLLACGLGGGTLSVLALLGIHRAAMISIAAIVYGAALAAGSSVTYAVELALPWREKRPAEAFPGSRAGASGVEILAGLGAVVLGILALSGFAVLPLNLIAALTIGTAVLFSGAVTSSEFMRML